MKSTQQFVNGYGTETPYKIIYLCTNTVAFSTYHKGAHIIRVDQLILLYKV